MHKSHQLTVQDYLRHETNHEGVCFRCHTWTGGVEPAAARLKCQSCGQPGVHGVDQALLQGFIHIAN